MVQSDQHCAQRLWIHGCISWASLAALCILLVACASPMKTARYSALEGDDLIAITGDMAMQLTGSPVVQRAIAEHGPLRVVILPVENYMTGEIMPEGQKNAFVGRLRALLAASAPESFVWIANRAAYQQMRQAELEAGYLGPDPDAMQPQYSLTARFDSITTDDRKRRESYYLTVYTLTDLLKRDVLWTGKYELKKSAVKGTFD